jgi:formylglycine-generating enzyme required for sulfatase activity
MTARTGWSLAAITVAFAVVAAPLLGLRGGPPNSEKAAEVESANEITSKTLPSLKLVRITAKGKSFMMGSPEGEKGRDKDEGRHEVRFTKNFYIGVTAVTRSQFAAFADDSDYEAGPYTRWKDNEVSTTDAQPVVYMNWDDAQAFCKWLSKKDGREYRLPTEAEWEYACRAGTKTMYSFGDDAEKLDQYAWYEKNSKGVTYTVGKKQPNAWGLYDMHGNVCQWCSDGYGHYPVDAVTDPQGPNDGSSRVVRGGSWLSRPQQCRSASRFVVPAFRLNFVGFRVALTVK